MIYLQLQVADVLQKVEERITWNKIKNQYYFIENKNARSTQSISFILFLVYLVKIVKKRLNF